MALKDNLASDMSIFFNTDEFAEDVLYGSNTVKAIINRGVQPKIDTITSADYSQVLVLKSQVSSPKVHDIVVFDDVAWVVENIQQLDQHSFLLTCHANEGAGKHV